MNSGAIIGLVSCGLICGCDSQPAMTGPAAKSQERYTGIGIYNTDRLWPEIVGSSAKADAAIAKLSDDSQIIVVVDGRTGEVRQCGNYSGFCVTMSPWSNDRVLVTAPTKLKRHATDLATEDEAAQSK